MHTSPLPPTTKNHSKNHRYKPKPKLLSQPPVDRSVLPLLPVVFLCKDVVSLHHRLYVMAKIAPVPPLVAGVKQGLQGSGR